MVNKYIRQALILSLATCLLSSCGERRHLQANQRYVTQLKLATDSAKTVAPSAGLAAPQAVIYQGANTRSPFVPYQTLVSNAHTSANPLQNFALEQLHYKGIVLQGDKTWGYVMAPDNKLYQVKIGDSIGEHYGKIISITTISLVIQEQLDQMLSLGKPNLRIITLQLKGPS